MAVIAIKGINNGHESSEKLSSGKPSRYERNADRYPETCTRLPPELHRDLRSCGDVRSGRAGIAPAPLRCPTASRSEPTELRLSRLPRARTYPRTTAPQSRLAPHPGQPCRSAAKEPETRGLRRSCDDEPGSIAAADLARVLAQGCRSPRHSSLAVARWTSVLRRRDAIAAVTRIGCINRPHPDGPANPPPDPIPSLCLRQQTWRFAGSSRSCGTCRYSSTCCAIR